MPAAADTPNALPAIRSADAWRALAYRPEYQGASRTEVVKVVIDLEDDWRPYFIQSARFELHFGFVKHILDASVDHGRFNIRQYRSAERDYILLSLVHYLDGDHWTFELVAGDQLDSERLLRAFEIIRSHVFFGETLQFRTLSPLHEARAAELGARLPVIDGQVLMSDVRYQAPVPGVAIGYLRITHGPLDPASVRPSDILVTDHVPNELPPASGLITGRLQAPLAHVAVLSRNRNTPDMALRDATRDERLTAFDGKLVRVIVGPQDFSIEEVELAVAEAHWASRRPSEGFSPTFDLSESDLLEVCALYATDTPRAGAKAAQLGVLCGMDDVETPGGFVVPFAHYDEQLRRSGAARSLGLALADNAFQQDARVREQTLERLRGQINDRRVPPRLLRSIRARMRDQAPNRRWIFRSSTNAEDLVGFNGAGLYSSVVVDSTTSLREIEAALREVWASVWLQRAYEERQWFRIDQLAVKMAVLIQPFVENVIGNGVAITRNPFDEARPAVYLNVQVRGGSVTGAGSDELPEEVLIYTWTPTYEFHILSRSTLTSGEAILETADLEAAGRLLQNLNDRLVPTYVGGANAVDVEFLLTEGDRRFVVVQARPITIRYTTGQGWRTP